MTSVQSHSTTWSAWVKELFCTEISLVLVGCLVGFVTIVAVIVGHMQDPTQKIIDRLNCV
jgi:hypothetical protein